MLAALAVEMPVAQILRLHLSFMKVSLAVTVGTDDCVFLSSFECC